MRQPQSFDAITLGHHATGLNTLLLGAKVSKIQHPNKDEFLVTFWGGEGGANLRGHFNTLYINLQPDYSVAYLIAPGDKERFIVNTLKQPTAFCMLLRKQLNNAKLKQVSSVADERILNFVFENFNELGNKVQLVLSLELMGKHSNMLLVDAVRLTPLSGPIIGVAHSVSERMSQHRELTAGLDYRPPPAAQGKRSWVTFTPAMIVDLLQRHSPEVWPEVLNRALTGFGQRIIEQAMQVSGSNPLKLAQILDGLYHGKTLTPRLTKLTTSGYSLLDLPGSEPQSSVQAMLYAYYTQCLVENRCHEIRNKLQHRVQQSIKKLHKRLTELTPISDAEIVQIQCEGNLILGALSMGLLPEKPIGDSIQLTHWESNEAITLTIEKHLSWSDNAALYFRRAKKAKARQATYEAFRAKLSDEQAYLEELSLLIEQADSLPDLETLSQEVLRRVAYDQHKTVKKNPKDDKNDKISGILKIAYSDQIEIWVGRSSEANGLLAGKLAKPEDWWLHVHQMPGSHVLVKAHSPLISLPDEVLLKAAALAAFYSKGRESKNVPVVYTQAKYVRKIPGSYPGHVTYTHEKTVFVSPR